jgi:hypothetical protein
MSISSQPIQPRQPSTPTAPGAAAQNAEVTSTAPGMAEATIPQANDTLEMAGGHDSYDELAAEMDGSRDAVAAPDDKATLNALYQEHLGRDVDPTGLDAWGKLAAEMRAGGSSEEAIKAALTDRIVKSPEYIQQKTNLGQAPATRGDADPAPSTEPAQSAGAAAGAAAAGAVSGSATSLAGKAPYINQVNPNGKDGAYSNGESNCGPTSMAMIARAAGYGEGMTDAQLIMHLGQMGGTTGDGTGVNGIAAMAQGIGKTAETRGPGANVEWIRSQLESGKMVVANGDYYAMGDHNRAKVGQGGHYVAVVGLDSDGKFLVNDPYDSAISPRAFSASELATFISSNSNGGYQVAVG